MATYQTNDPSADVTLTFDPKRDKAVLLTPGMLQTSDASAAALELAREVIRREYPDADVYVDPALWVIMMTDDSCYACVTGRYACDIHTPEQAARMRPLRRVAWAEVAA